MSFDNMMQVVRTHGTVQPRRPCLRFFRDGAWRDLVWGDFLARVQAIAGGLAALGVEPGDRVAIVSANRPEWALADLGGLAATAVVATVYPTLTPDETAFILGHCGACLVFVENREQLEKVRAIRHHLPQLRHLVVLEGDGEADAHSLAAVEALASAAASRAVVERAELAPRSTPLTIVYTSGTTGVPKGAVLTHGNVIGTIEAVLQAFGDVSRLQLNLSFLPLAHALERIAGHFLPLYLGRTIAYARSLDTLAEDFQAVRPQFAVAVPRVFEKVASRIQTQVAAKAAPARALFDWAVATGTARSRLQEAGRALPLGLRARAALADALVFRTIRARLGGRMELFVSGGAPLAEHVARFFHAAGILICEGWGATETSAPATWNTPVAFRFGSVGKPIPGVEVETAADGELLVRGVNVFAGYHDDPEETAAVLEPSGFFRTGDIGTVDADGFFYITDRKKELIILASGKNIAPQKIENGLKQQPLISNAMAFGDRHPYLVALITLDRAALAARHPELAAAAPNAPGLRDLLAAQVAAANGQLARFEQVKRFAIVEPDFTPEGGELTLTMKLKRRIIEAKHRDTLAGLYAEEREAAR
jgi:long-chain acyl-CoA synthetase